MIIVSIFCTNDLDFCTNVVNTALNFENAREGRASIVHRAIQLILKRVNSYCDHRYYERIALYDRHGPNPPEEAAGPSAASLHDPTITFYLSTDGSLVAPCGARPSSLAMHAAWGTRDKDRPSQVLSPRGDAVMK